MDGESRNAPVFDRKQKHGITGGDSSFDLATVDGQVGYVRLTAHGFFCHFQEYSYHPLSPMNFCTQMGMAFLRSICDLLSLPVLIDCNYTTGYCYSLVVDNSSERVYDTDAGGVPADGSTT